MSTLVATRPAAPAPLPRKGTGRLIVLDGLRGFAVLYVVVFHFYMNPPPDADALRRIFFALIGFGFSGVDLFFVLSGFLITGILLANLHSPHYFSSFYARRVLRIFPLYYLLCFVFLVLLPALPFLVQHDFFWVQSGSSIYFWLFLNNLGLLLPVRFHQFLDVAWSLAIEEQFYLAWPLLLWLVGKRRALQVSVALFVLSPLLRNLLFFGFGLEASQLYTATFTRLEPITLGSIIAIMMSEPARYRRALRLLSAQCVVTVPLLIGYAVYFGQFQGGSPDAPLLFLSTPMVAVGYTLNALAYGGVLLQCLAGESALTWILTTRPLLKCGKYSYAMYLLHPICWFASMHLCLFLAERTGVHAFATRTLIFAIGFVFTYGAAAVSWRLIESKAMALKDRFAYRHPSLA